MQIYSYKRICDKCGKEWKERRLEPYKSFRPKMTCPDCQSKTEHIVVQDLGGVVNSGKNCGTCCHFKPIQGGKLAWGKCGLGHVLDNEEEYTLTHAIDNIGRCMLTEKDHEQYGDDVEGLVNSLDYCKEYEPK